VAYSGGRFVQRIRYADGSGWDNTPEFNQGQFSRILEGQVDLDGFLKVGINPEIEAEIWGSLGPAPRLKLFTLPRIGLNFYAKAELDLLPDDVAVEISQPQAGSTLDGRESITLNARATGDPQLRLLAGVDFTLRDGRVEDECLFPQANNTARSANEDECIPEIYIDSSKHPEAAQHAREAIANGKPTILTIDRDPPLRKRVRDRRNQSIENSGLEPCPKNENGEDQERDEYPPAMFLENAGSASVKCIKASDNLGSGASIGNQARRYPEFTKVKLVIR
jgi:hypothetical protein